MRRGIFYAVSVGAGSPDLLTVRAVRVLSACHVLCFPETDFHSFCFRSSESHSSESHHIAYDAVSGAIDVTGKDIRFYPIPMTRDRAVVCAEYERIASECAVVLRAGNDVAFAAIGDVSLYSTVGRIAERVRALGGEVQYVPGVNSFSAASCEACIPLADRDEGVSIIPGDAFYIEETLRAALLSPGTKILMKMGRRLREILALVDALGLSEQATLVQKVSLPGQKIFRGEELRHLDGSAVEASYLSILIVENNA